MTKEKVWFNQAHLFHFSVLEIEVAQSLLSEFGEQNLPRNAYYGDGEPIEENVLARIRYAHEHEAIVFNW